VVAASIVNAATAWYLRRVTARHHSPALEATSRHLMTDIWTSTAVVASVVLVSLTGFELLDPMIGVVAGLHITREGWRVTTGAMSSLLDVRLPEEEEAALMDVLREEPRVLGFHRLRSRRAGINRFLEVDIFVDPRLDVRGAHDIATALEDRIARLLPNLTATLHIEPYLEGTRDVTLTPREEFQPDGG
jgi:cation diffusion facilitator family transporter